MYLKKFLFLFSFVFCVIFSSDLGIICVPVADLVGSPLDVVHPILGSSIAERYARLPYCGVGIFGGIACPRVHQGLFNEIVQIVSTHEHQICITIPNYFYITHDNQQPQNMYWTLKENVLPLCQIKNAHVLPKPHNFLNRQLIQDNSVFALTQPFFDPILQLQFSAGTRFKIDKKNSTDKTLAVYALDPQKKRTRLIFIPRDKGIIEEKRNLEQSRALFLSLVRAWTHPEMGMIAYVWGGCSHTNAIKENIFTEAQLQLDAQKQVTFFLRPTETAQVKTGFDCAGLVARAAQLAGIPYFYKNTLTLATYLKPVEKHDILQEGDLIWFPGHVMIVNDLKKHTLIEARSYASGYGIIHEIALEKVFKGIDSYQALQAAFAQKKALARLNREGSIVESVKHFKLLKLLS